MMNITNIKSKERKLLSPIKGFFLGRILDPALFPFPKVANETKENVELLLASIDRFMTHNSEHFTTFDKEAIQPEWYLKQLKELGLFSLIIPAEYEGLELSSIGYARIIQQLSHYDGSTALTVGAHSSIGMKALLMFGTAEQKKRYFNKLATGESIAAFCLTESSAGSDAAAIKTTAVKNNEGHWILNGEKIWITNGPIASFFTVFARTGEDGAKGISAFIVERSWNGVEVGKKEDKLGIRASATSTVLFKDVQVPADCIIGNIGDGFKIAVSVLNNGRSGLGGGCIGAMKRCINLATQQALERKQFGQTISNFPLIQEKLTSMTVKCFATESIVQMVSSYIDEGMDDYSVEAAVAKVFATESLWYCAYESLQIAGGNGYIKEFPYEIITRDSRINTIFEGTNEILRLYIGLTCAQETGKYLKNIQEAVGEIISTPIESFETISQYIMNKIVSLATIPNKVSDNLDIKLHEYQKILNRYIVALGTNTEYLVKKYGKDLINQQLMVKRLADIAIDLFTGYCVLSRASSLLNQNPEDSQVLNIVKIFIHDAKRRMRSNLRRIEKNEDKAITELSNHLVGSGGYKWDSFFE
jgi:acyl-CoA dehydrogenase family member 9